MRTIITALLAATVLGVKFNYAQVPVDAFLPSLGDLCA